MTLPTSPSGTLPPPIQPAAQNAMPRNYHTLMTYAVVAYGIYSIVTTLCPSLRHRARNTRRAMQEERTPVR